MRHNRPRIGITMRIESETNRFYLGRHYSEAVEAAGGLPIHISLIPNREYLTSLIEDLDGILLPGSDSDVDPFLYNRQPHAKLGTVQPLKDETDLIVLEEVELHSIPLFAICFGMQVLNVSRKGTLIQDIPSQLPDAINHQQGSPRDRRSHHVQFLPTSLLRSLAGDDNSRVNSHHHQAIETVGENLIAAAWAKDGLIEALEDSRDDRFVLAVQWHPELGWEKDSLSQSLFTQFVNEARQYSKQRALEYAVESNR